MPRRMGNRDCFATPFWRQRFPHRTPLRGYAEKRCRRRMPFSFAECRRFLRREASGGSEWRAQLRRDYDAYFRDGGFPETFGISDKRVRIVDALNWLLEGDSAPSA